MRDEVPAPAPGIQSALIGRGGLAPIAGGSPEADEQGGFAAAPRTSGVATARSAPEITAVALLFAAACVFFGIFPSPLFDLAAHAGRALGLG
jgi:NADH-quinone oxidoreductase subunit N